MSYLHTPRLHFAGRFQADTSTINNDVRHFDDARFRRDFQELMKVDGKKIVKYNGYWNPEGTGAWRMLGCRITAAVLGGRTFTSPQEDPAVGLLLGGSDDRVAGKLVDLDPQQQMVSEIWGLAIRVQDAAGHAAFDSEFEVSPFCDIWLRQQKADQAFDQQLAAAYQSQLTSVSWSDVRHSATLQALKEHSAEGLLSMRMNVFGYDRTPDAPDYTTGVVVGTIGPADADEPQRFVMGRQLIAALDPSSPFVPKNRISNIQALVDAKAHRVSADFGNALPIETSRGDLEDLGPLAFGVLKNPEARQGDALTAAEIEILGPIPYQEHGWYPRTAGIVDFEFGTVQRVRSIIANHPLAVVKPNGDQYTVLNRETADGLFVRADNFVYRLNPGDCSEVELYASRYGAPLAATVTTRPTVGFMGGAGTGAKLPTIPIPDVNTPDGVVDFAAEIQTNAEGRGTLTLEASEDGPGNPRDYLDGQLYGIAYQLKDQPPSATTSPFNYISILAWDKYEIPDPLTWYGAIQPILRQYANLYPIMSRRLFDLADYDCVVRNLSTLRLSFALPLENPNSMPVTRDLSAAKRRAILHWLDNPDPATGLPVLGEPGPELEAVATAETAEAASEAPHLASKIEFLRQALAHQRR